MVAGIQCLVGEVTEVRHNREIEGLTLCSSKSGGIWDFAYFADS
jgi:hypothetical protein